MNLVDIVNPNWEANDFELAKQMVNYGLMCFNSGRRRKMQIEKLYRMYHGKYTQKEKTELTNVHGRTSSTPFAPYHLAKVKIDQILGESLQVGFSIEVDTISPVEKQKKADAEMTAKGRSYNKPIIQAVQKQGFNIYNGVQVPDFSPDMKFDIEEFRTRNELITQRMINAKTKDAINSNLYYSIFSSNIFASEAFCLSVIDNSGKATLKFIEPERMIYPPIVYDQFLEAVPIIGHHTQMTFTEILRKFNIKKDSSDYIKISKLFVNAGGGPSTIVPMVTDGEYEGSFNFNAPAQLYSSNLTTTVYYFQWRYNIEKTFMNRTDGSTFLVDDEDEEIKIQKENSPGSFVSIPFERIYQGASINGQIYVGFQDLTDFGVSVDIQGRTIANYDYTCSLIKTFGNDRTPFAKVLFDIGRQYDKARWLLFREIKKIKTGAIYINKQYMKDQPTDSILYDLEDKGVVNYDTSEQFNETGETISNGNQIVGAINVGSSSSIIRDLISVCLDLERVFDSNTGMNDARKGTEMATTTATTNNNNLQASRATTYDLFYFPENHMQRSFTNLIRKTKSAIRSGSKEGYAYLSADDLAYLESSPDYYNDNFEARIVGGRRSQTIFAELSELIKSEVTAGKRSSADFVEIRESESLREAREVLRLSDEKLQSIAQQSQDADNQAKLQMNKTTTDASIANREDEQAAEKELQDSINETGLEETKLKIMGQIQQSREIPPSIPASKKTKK